MSGVIKLYRLSEDGKPYAKAAKTLPAGTTDDQLAKALEDGRYGAWLVKEIPLNPRSSLNCNQGHPRAQWWTVTAGGRKYCRKCATEASKRSKAKAKKKESK